MPLALVSLSHISASWDDLPTFRQRIGPVDHAPVTLVAAFPSWIAWQTRPCNVHSQIGESSPPRPWLSPWNHSQSFPDRKSTRLNSSHLVISYAVFCLKKKKT